MNKIEKLGFGDHICYLYKNFNVYREDAIQYVLNGLSSNEKVVCVISEYPKDLLIQDLKKSNSGINHFIETGQLIITSNKNVYGINGCFDLHETIEYWKKELREIEKEKFHGVRFMAEMDFALDGTDETLNKLMEYELWSNNELVTLYDKALYLCIFNTRKFPNFVLEDMIRKHNVVMNDGKLLKPNPYCISLKDQIGEYQGKINIQNHFSLNVDYHDNVLYEKNNSDSKDVDILKHVLSNTGDGVWEWDVKLKKIYLSDSCYSMLGYGKKEVLIGQDNLIELLHPEDFQGFKDVVSKCYKNQIDSFNYEIRAKKKSGEWIWLYIKGLPIKKDLVCGNVLKMVGILNNITETKRIKRELEEKVYFEKLRTDFFSNLSHELRTPLNIILGSLQLQELYVKSDSTSEYIDRYREIQKRMKQNCYRLLRLVNNMVDITRIDAGFYNLKLESYDIVRLIRDIILTVEDYVKSKALGIQFNSSLDKVIMACDSEKIERVILNLLSNAIKFTESGGIIEIDVDSNDEEVSISVKDSGIGIPKEKLNSIFDRFVQVDKSLTRKHEGSGIGLSLVKSIVDMHGGRISVKSDMGKGSEFIITLPIRLVEDSNRPMEEAAVTSQGNVERIDIEFSDIYF